MALFIPSRSWIVFFVDKKDKELRPSIDDRGLYGIAVKNRYPLALISTPLKHMSGATGMPPACSSTCEMHAIMSFGLTSDLEVFQAFINDMLRDMSNWFSSCFLSSPIVQRRLENKLFAKAEKFTVASSSPLSFGGLSAKTTLELETAVLLRSYHIT